MRPSNSVERREMKAVQFCSGNAGRLAHLEGCCKGLYSPAQNGQAYGIQVELEVRRLLHLLLFQVP